MLKMHSCAGVEEEEGLCGGGWGVGGGGVGGGGGGGGGTGRGIRPPLPESRPPLEIWLAIFFPKGKWM